MTPDWTVIEKLVSELGAVCHSQHAIQVAAVADGESVAAAETALQQATKVVSAALRQSDEHDDAVVLQAWEALAVAQDAMARLAQTMERSRQIRERARELQEQSGQRLRHSLRPRLGTSPARRDPSSR